MSLRSGKSHFWAAAGATFVVLCMTCLVPIVLPTGALSQHGEPQNLSWSTAQFIAPLDSAAAVTVGNCLYLIGGRNSQGMPVNGVHLARIDANGSPGSWQAVSSTLPKPLYSHAAVAVDNRIYVVGGYSGAYEGAAYVATVGTDGALAGWQTVASLPEGERRATHAMVAADGFLYVLGGLRISDVLDTVYRTRIRADGTLESWTADRSLPSPLYRHTAVVYNHAVYVIGGRPNATSVSRKVYRAVIQNDGALGPWEEVGNNLLPGARADHVSFVVGDKLSVVGGFDGVAAQSTVYVFRLGDTVTQLDDAAPLPQPRYRAAGALSPLRYAYVAGGLDGSNQSQNTVYFTRLATFARQRYLPLLLIKYAEPMPPVTVTPTRTATVSPPATATATRTATATTPAATPTRTGTPTLTATPSVTAAVTGTVTPTPTTSVQPAEADVEIEKQANPTAVSPLATVTFEVKVRNRGQGDALNVLMDDTLPTQLEVLLPIDGEGGFVCIATTPTQVLCTKTVLPILDRLFAATRHVLVPSTAPHSAARPSWQV